MRKRSRKDLCVVGRNVSKQANYDSSVLEINSRFVKQSMFVTSTFNCLASSISKMGCGAIRIIRQLCLFDIFLMTSWECLVQIMINLPDSGIKINDEHLHKTCLDSTWSTVGKAWKHRVQLYSLYKAKPSHAGWTIRGWTDSQPSTVLR